jgi:hypothetical protein
MNQPPGRSRTYGHDSPPLPKTKAAAARRERKPFKPNYESVDQPECGFYLVKLIARGPLVPARIFWSAGCDPETGEDLDRPSQLCAEVAGEVCEIWEVWHGRRQPTTEADYQFRLDTIRWARAHKPEMPECYPRKPINHADLPPIVDLFDAS